MAAIGNPFVKFKCAGCNREIERQVSARRCAQELDALRDGPPLYCAACPQAPTRS